MYKTSKQISNAAHLTAYGGVSLTNYDKMVCLCISKLFLEIFSIKLRTVLREHTHIMVATIVKSGAQKHHKVQGALIDYTHGSL